MSNKKKFIRSIHLPSQTDHLHFSAPLTPDPLRIIQSMEGLKEETKMTVRIIEEVIKDCVHCGWTYTHLQQQKFSTDNLKTIQSFKPHDGEPLLRYIRRLKKRIPKVLLENRRQVYQDYMERLNKINTNDMKTIREYYRIYRNMLKAIKY